MTEDERNHSTSTPRPRANLTAYKWDIIANTLFLKYITTRLALRPYAWGPWSTYGHDEMPQGEATRVAVWHKNLFAEEMSGLNHLPALDLVQRLWSDTTQRMERDIALRLSEL